MVINSKTVQSNNRAAATEQLKDLKSKRAQMVSKLTVSEISQESACCVCILEHLAKCQSLGEFIMHEKTISMHRSVLRERNSSLPITLLKHS